MFTCGRDSVLPSSCSWIMTWVDLIIHSEIRVAWEERTSVEIVFNGGLLAIKLNKPIPLKLFFVKVFITAIKSKLRQILDHRN